MDSFFHYLQKIFGAVSSILLALVGTLVLLYGAYESLHAIEGIIVHPETDMKNVSAILHSVDLIFLGLVIQLLSIGLFELFVHELKKLPA
ncbi:MAG: YqhA family protein [Bacteroidota bacterium]